MVIIMTVYLNLYSLLSVIDYVLSIFPSTYLIANAEYPIIHPCKVLVLLRL